jgi:hypothetical protein
LGSGGETEIWAWNRAARDLEAAVVLRKLGGEGKKQDSPLVEGKPM